jgi:hypothetical protein
MPETRVRPVRQCRTIRILDGPAKRAMRVEVPSEGAMRVEASRSSAIGALKNFATSVKALNMD